MGVNIKDSQRSPRDDFPSCMHACAVVLIYGSYAILKEKSWKGGILNILAGTVVPIPTYLYFAFFSQPKLLSWLIPVGFFILVPPLLSGILSVLLPE